MRFWQSCFSCFLSSNGMIRVKINGKSQDKWYQLSLMTFKVKEQIVLDGCWVLFTLLTCQKECFTWICYPLQHVPALFRGALCLPSYLGNTWSTPRTVSGLFWGQGYFLPFILPSIHLFTCSPIHPLSVPFADDLKSVPAVEEGRYTLGGLLLTQR